MGQSLVKNYVHIIFSTKNREPIIYPEFETELHSYLTGICNNLDCLPIKIGGFTDHIHILCMLSKRIALMNLVEKLKSNSSKWMKTKSPLLKKFYWQDGYGAFSINPTDIQIAIDYISNQHTHHTVKTFKSEYIAFLKKYMVDYDDKYVWS